MHPWTKSYLCDENGRRFFGPGPYRLLQGVEQTGSLHAAATGMNMAYTKALALMRGVEAALGGPVILSRVGGKGGGGSTLTPKAKELMERYERYDAACAEANRSLFESCFCGFGQAPSDPDGQP